MKNYEYTNYDASQIESDYLGAALQGGETLSRMAYAIAQILHQYDVKFDAFAFCGNSGALMAPVLSTIMMKPLILVRKEEVKPHTHSYLRVEGATRCSSYVIVDDFVCSGATVQFIVDSIDLHCKNMTKKPKCCGLVEYKKINSDRGFIASKLGMPIFTSSHLGRGYSFSESVM